MKGIKEGQKKKEESVFLVKTLFNHRPSFVLFQILGTNVLLRVGPQRRGDPALQPGEEHQGRPLRSQVKNSASDASQQLILHNM